MQDTIGCHPQHQQNRGTTSISPQFCKAAGRFFLIAVLGIHALFLWRVRERIGRGDPDFTVFYTAGKMLREGRASQLYEGRAQQAAQDEFTRDSDLRKGPLPYIHPPFEALLFVPLTYLAYRDAFVLWNVLNVGILLGVAVLVHGFTPRLREFAVWEWGLACLAFFPVFTNFLQGQDAILLLFLFVVGFRAMDRDADFLAGCWFGLGVFKYHLVLPLILILALWRGRRVLLGFATTASAASLISLLIVGWRGAAQYPAFAWSVVSTPGHGQTPLGLLPNLLGLMTGWPFLSNMLWLRWVVLAASAGLLFVVALMRRFAQDPRFFRICFAAAVTAALLVGYNTNAHDLSLLILPLALLADYCAPLSWREKSRIVLPVAALLISPLWFFLWLRWEHTNLMAIFLLWWLDAVRREMSRAKAVVGGSENVTSPV